MVVLLLGHTPCELSVTGQRGVGHFPTDEEGVGGPGREKGGSLLLIYRGSEDSRGSFFSRPP